MLSIFLLSLRIDYRFIETINCCGDDHTYFVHAETIAEDFDLDYSNQMNFVGRKVIMSGNKIVPIDLSALAFCRLHLYYLEILLIISLIFELKQ